MKAKTIKKVIRAKIDAWLASIEDEELCKLLSKNVIVTGGAIASMLLKERVNDYDIYFRNKEAAVAAAKYYVARFTIKKRSGIECRIWVDDEGERVRIMVKSAGIASEGGADKPYEYFEASARDESAGEYVSEVMGDPADIEDAREDVEDLAADTEDEPGRPPYRPVFLSTNAISLSGRIQLVLRFYGEPEAIHENYDFAHCTNYWCSWNDDLVLRPAALEALLTKELRYVGSKYPICSLFRLRKFIGRGWSINAGQVLKIAMQVSALDLNDVEVLQDQLTGVDCAYFMEVITKIKEKDPTRLESAYLIEIIDRMF